MEEPEYIIWRDFLVLFFELLNKETLKFSEWILKQDEALLYIMRRIRSIWIELFNSDEDIKAHKEYHAAN